MRLAARTARQARAIIVFIMGMAAGAAVMMLELPARWTGNQRPVSRPGKPYVNSNGLTLGRTVLFSNNFASCETHRVQTINSGVVDDWLIFQERDHINVMVQRASDGKFLFFRQQKYALYGDVLAPVGGLIEDGEPPLNSAMREVAEEAGMVCAHWRQLGRKEGFPVQANRFGGLGFYFHACGCSDTDAAAVAELAGTAGLDDEVQTQTWVTAAELRGHVFAGDVQEVKWSAMAALTLLSMPDAPQECRVGAT